MQNRIGAFVDLRLFRGGHELWRWWGFNRVPIALHLRVCANWGWRSTEKHVGLSELAFIYWLFFHYLSLCSRILVDLNCCLGRFCLMSFHFFGLSLLNGFIFAFLLLILSVNSRHCLSIILDHSGDVRRPCTVGLPPSPGRCFGFICSPFLACLSLCAVYAGPSAAHSWIPPSLS